MSDPGPGLAPVVADPYSGTRESKGSSELSAWSVSLASSAWGLEPGLSEQLWYRPHPATAAAPDPTSAPRRLGLRAEPALPILRET